MYRARGRVALVMLRRSMRRRRVLELELSALIKLSLSFCATYYTIHWKPRPCTRLLLLPLLTHFFSFSPTFFYHFFSFCTFISFIKRSILAFNFCLLIARGVERYVLRLINDIQRRNSLSAGILQDGMWMDKISCC